MSNAARKLETHDIVVEDVFPHAPSTIWKVLTTGAFKPVVSALATRPPSHPLAPVKRTMG